MTKNVLNFMYLLRICESSNLNIPEDIYELDFEDISKKHFEKLLNIFIQKYYLCKKESICFSDIDSNILNESENLNMNKYGLEMARNISSVSLFISSVEELFLLCESKDFIDSIDNILALGEAYFTNYNKIKSLGSSNLQTSIIDENDDLLDILF